MKNILILISFIFILFSCDKKETVVPTTYKYYPIYDSRIAVNKVIGIFGTSIDYGTGATPIDSSWANRFKRAAQQKGYTVLNYGLPNATYMDSTLYSVWSRMRATKNIHFDTIIFGGPTNDAQVKYYPKSITRFPREYKRAIDSMQLWHPNAVIICVTAIKSLSPIIPQTRLDSFNTIVIDIAHQYNLKICNFSLFGAQTILSSDDIHPGNKGHKILGNCMIDFIFNKDDNNEVPIPIEDVIE